MSIFDCTEVYIISLDKTLADFQDIVKYFPHAQVVKAVDMRGVEVSTLPNEEVSMRAKLSIRRGQDTSEDVVSGGSVGCSKSHLKCWNKFLATNAPYCVVLEDDVVLRKEKMYQLPRYINSADKMGADFVSFGAIYQGLSTDNLFKKHDQYAVQVYMFLLTHAQKITRRGAQILVKYFYPINMQVDGYISTLARFGYLVASAPRHQIIRQRLSLKSSVQQVLLPMKTYMPRCNASYLVIFLVIIILFTLFIASLAVCIKKESAFTD